MTDRIKKALALAAIALPALAAGPAQAAPVNVTLRVEGRNGTIFEGNTTTDAHLVKAANDNQFHKCDGTNGGAHPNPGPTATGALDDGAKLRRFTWSGDWYQSFEDFVVTRIGPDSQTSSEFWNVFVDFVDPQVGGCQARVASGDEVLWAFDGFGKTPLRLSGPDEATTGRPITVRVVDGRDGSPEAGARVAGVATGADGRARLRFDRAGAVRVKASKAGAIRSNGLVVCADPPGAVPCSSSDRTAPDVRLVLPGEYASQGSRSRSFFLSWFGEEGATGSGVAGYDVRVRELANGVGPRRLRGGRAWRLPTRALETGSRFRGRSGRSYEFQVVATDRAANEGSETGKVIFPVDDRDRKVLGLTRGWKRLKRTRAWGRTVLRSKRRGARGRLRFRGRRVAIIGRELPRGGRLLVSVDGRKKVLNLRGRTGFRKLLYLTAGRRPGRHLLRFKALGRRPVEIDAIAPVP